MSQLLKCNSERYNTLNVLRLFYQESRDMVAEGNRGQLASVNLGYWLNQCKKDKRVLREHAEELKAQFNKRK